MAAWESSTAVMLASRPLRRLDLVPGDSARLAAGSVGAAGSSAALASSLTAATSMDGFVMSFLGVVCFGWSYSFEPGRALDPPLPCLRTIAP